MAEKVQSRKKVPVNIESEPKNDVVKVIPKLIMFGIATMNLDNIEKGEKVSIFEDKGEDWLTDKGLASKKFMLLRKIK